MRNGAATRSWRAPPTVLAASSPPPGPGTGSATGGMSSTPCRSMSHRPRAVALAAGLAMTTAVGGAAPAQDTSLPQTPGWELVMRCLMCHSVEIAVQQRFGPEGWSDTLDRMIKYGAPIPPEDKQRLLAYLLRHFRDPAGR